VEINHFIPTEDAITDVVATMNYLSKSDAIIFDLRRHRGGNGEIVQLLLSYLFRAPTLINTIYDRTNDTIYQIWTHKVVTSSVLQEYNPSIGKFTTSDSTSVGPLLANLTKADIYVLTSDFTFSAGEEFAYDLQSLKRATIIGSVTGAGGNPTRFYPLNQNFVISIPWATSINPVTGKGWEAEGVTPDIEVHPSKALETAHYLAISKLGERADENAKVKLDFDLEVAKAMYHKVEIPQSLLQQYAGDYGEYRIITEVGILYSKRGRYGKLPLDAITTTTFLVNEDQKIEFTFDGNQVTGLDVVNRNGNRNSYKRNRN
jgi:C-terminal processing protease CtpA/Prc